jgi:hypothetical protein
MNPTRHLLALYTVIALAADGGQAKADTVTFNTYTPGTTTYPVYWSSASPVLFSDLGSPLSGSTVGGVFDLTVNGLPCRSFCVDLTHYIPPFSVPNSNYSFVDPLSVGLNQTQITDLDRLLTSYGNLVDAAPQNAAAFQMAVWEITNEASGSYDLGSGNFTESGNTQAVSLANTWITNLGTQNNYSIEILKSSDGHQSQMTWTPVPEPGSAMLIGSFGLLLITRRRRVA